MVDTSSVLERAISALKRSQRFREVSDEVRAAEELDKQRLEKHNFIKTHALRKMTDEEVERMLGIPQGQSAGGVAPTPAIVSKVPPIIKKSQREYPRVKAAKPVPVSVPIVPPEEAGCRSGSSANTTISSPSQSRTRSSTSRHRPQRQQESAPSPSPALSRRDDNDLEEPQTEPERDLSTMSQISTYKSSIQDDHNIDTDKDNQNESDRLDERVRSIGAIFEAAAASKVNADDDADVLTEIKTASEPETETEASVSRSKMSKSKSRSMSVTFSEAVQGSGRRPEFEDDLLGPSPKQAEAMKSEYRKALSKLRKKRDRERGFQFGPLAEARSTDKMVKSLGEYYRKSKAEAEAAEAMADKSNVSSSTLSASAAQAAASASLSVARSRISEHKSTTSTKTSTKTDSSGTKTVTATEQSIYTIYDASMKSKSGNHSRRQDQDQDRRQPDLAKAESIAATYTDTFEEPSASDTGKSLTLPSTKSTPKNQSQQSQSQSKSVSQSKPQSQGKKSNASKSERKSSAPAPAKVDQNRDDGQDEENDPRSHVRTYSYAHRSPSEALKLPSGPGRPTPDVPARLMRISPELGQELSSIMENLQSMSTTTTEDRTSAPSPRARRPAPPDSPEVTYTQDFLSDHEAEFIHELKNVGLGSAVPGGSVKAQAVQPRAKVPMQTRNAVASAPTKILAFPPGIEPNLDQATAAGAGYLMQPIQREGQSGGAQPRTDFYTKFLNEVVESNERMYNATIAAAKGMAKVYHKQQQEYRQKQKGKGHGHGHGQQHQAKPKSGIDRR